MNSNIPIYQTFDHTSDLGVLVFGANLETLFKNSIKALNSLLIEKEMTGGERTKNIELESTDREMLLHDFIAEALYLFWSENLLITDIKFTNLSKNYLKGQAQIYDISNKQIEINREIKAVTYHQLEIGKRDDYFYAKVVLDI